MAQRRSKYKQLVDGEGVELKSGEHFKFACCDCGLVHRVVIVAKGRDIGLAMKRDKRATAGRRRATANTASDDLAK